jgi:hypothetical protein
MASASSSAANRRGNVGSRKSAAVNATPMASDSGFNFIHFGCWNNDGCGETNSESGLTHMMAKLKTQLPQIKPEIVLVTGDNYYPVKPEKSLYALTHDIIEKQFVSEVFKSGWDCLNTTLESVKPRTYVLLGNHDLEKKEGIKPEECVIKDERDKIDGFNMVDLCNVKCIGSTMFVMFTSSIFDTDFDKDDDKNQKKKRIIEKCAKQIKAFSGDDITTLDEMRTHAVRIINEMVTSEKQKCDSKGIKILNLVFVCHDPLVCYKYKSADKDKKKDKGKKEEKKEKEGDAGEEKKKDKKVQTMPFGGEKYMDLLCGIIETVKPINNYYLCADLHQYQEGDIAISCKGCSNEYTIHQCISGTGGAEQDDEIPMDAAKELNGNPTGGFGKYKVNYNMDKSIMKFGFTLAIVDPKSGIRFVPMLVDVSAASASVFKGGRLMKKRGARTTRRRVKRVLKTTIKKW